jgi:surface antigen
VARELGRIGINAYPEQVQEFLRSYTSAVGNQVLKTLVENPAKEARGQKTTSIFYDRFVSQQDDDRMKQMLYYNVLGKADKATIKASRGEELTPQEKRLAKLSEEVKSLNASAAGKQSAATKAEKQGRIGQAKMYANQAEKLRDKAQDMALKEYKRLN